VVAAPAAQELRAVDERAAAGSEAGSEAKRGSRREVGARPRQRVSSQRQPDGRDAVTAHQGQQADTELVHDF